MNFDQRLELLNQAEARLLRVFSSDFQPELIHFNEITEPSEVVFRLITFHLQELGIRVRPRPLSESRGVVIVRNNPEISYNGSMPTPLKTAYLLHALGHLNPKGAMSQTGFSEYAAIEEYESMRRREEEYRADGWVDGFLAKAMQTQSLRKGSLPDIVDNIRVHLRIPLQT